MRGLLEAVFNVVCIEPALCRLGQANTLQGESQSNLSCAGAGGATMQGQAVLFYMVRGPMQGKSSATSCRLTQHIAIYFVFAGTLIAL